MILTESQRRRRAFFKRFRFYGIIAGTLLLFIGAGALLLKAPWWTEMTLVVNGTQEETAAEIVQDLKRSIFKVTRSALLGSDHYYAWPEEFPYSASAAATVEIEKKLWDKEIIFTVTPRQQYAVWCAESDCAWIDPAGVPFAAAPIAEGQLVRTVYAPATVLSQKGSRPVVETGAFAIIKKIIDEIARLDLTVTKITYQAELSELHLQTDTGAILLLSTRFDPEPTALPALKRFITKPGLSSLEYVNLTVENRAFIKYK